MEFRNYQKEIIEKASDVLIKNGMVYLAMEVRTGKTLTSIGISEYLGAESVLFITKKRAIRDIEVDALMFSPVYSLNIINYESLHKLDPNL